MGNIQSVSYRMPQRILDDIDDERRKQDTKWGDQSGNAAPVWMTILTEEVGETAKEVLNSQWAPHHLPGNLGFCRNCLADPIQQGKDPLIWETEPCPGPAIQSLPRLRAELIQVIAVAVAWVEAIDQGVAVTVPSVVTGPTGKVS